MNITATIWNFVTKHVNAFKIVVTRSGAWNFIIKQVAWKIKITQQGNFHFIIVPAGYWILRDGTWDDNGIWIDSEVWNDS